VTDVYVRVYKYIIQVFDIYLVFIRCIYLHNTRYTQVQLLLQSIQSFIVYVKTATCFDYTNVAFIRLDMGTNKKTVRTQ